MSANKINSSVRTDLAIEAYEKIGKETDGICVSSEEHNGIKTTVVEIKNEHGAEIAGKPIGKYITIEAVCMRENDKEAHDEVVKLAAKKLTELGGFRENALTLVIGLGNRRVTPDSLGPATLDKILVTRHLYSSGEVPYELEGGISPVAAISPGVMGITGIETGEVIQSIVKKIKPALVIAVDALASGTLNRINATIQMTDSGISPGAGVGNKRRELSKKTLGIPVIAIGIPTVVDAATIVSDTLDMTLAEMIKSADPATELFKMLSKMGSDERHSLISDILSPAGANMFVAPKESDALITRLSGILSNVLNISLHKGISSEDINRYVC